MPIFELLGAVDDHDVAGREAFLDDPVAALLLAHFDVALLGLARAVDDPDVVFVLQYLHRALRNQQRVRALARRDDHADVLPGMQELLRIRHREAQREGVGAQIDGGIDEVHLCRQFVLAAVGEQNAEIALTGIVLIERSAEFALDLQQALLADAEIRVHRIGLVDGRQQRRVGGHDATEAYQRPAHDTVDRRTNLRVPEVQRGGRHRRLGGLYLGMRRVIGRDRGVELSLAERVDFRERARPREIADRLRLGCVRLREQRLRLGERRSVGLRIDLEQGLPALDRRAFECHLAREDSADLRSNLDGIRRLELRGVFLRQRGRLRPHRQRRDGLRRRRSGRFAATGGGRRETRDQQEPRDCFWPSCSGT